jgi:hypothetical protein
MTSSPFLVSKLKQSVKLAKQGRRSLVTAPVDMPEGTVRRHDGTVRLPKSPAACADLLYSTREKRLSLQRELDRMSELESALKEYFIQTLPKSSATGIAGKVARVQIEDKPIPTIEDSERLYAYIKKTGAFDLLQRRLNESAVKERYEDGKVIPGVGIFHAKKVSCTRIK